MDIASRSSSNLAVQVLSRLQARTTERTPAATTGAGREQTEASMRISRRDLLLGSASALSAATLPFPKPAIAQTEPIKIGCLAAMTGPSSAPTIGFNRGVAFATDEINGAGGVKGRKIEIVMRDTQGDPTK